MTPFRFQDPVWLLLLIPVALIGFLSLRRRAELPSCIRMSNSCVICQSPSHNG